MNKTILFTLFIYLGIQVQCLPTVVTTDVSEDEWTYIYTSESPEIPIPPTNEHTDFEAYRTGVTMAEYPIVKDAITTLLTKYDEEIQGIFKDYDYQKDIVDLSFLSSTNYSIRFKNKANNTKGVLTLSFLPLMLPTTERLTETKLLGGKPIYYSSADLCYRIHSVILKNGERLPDFAIYTPACGNVMFMRDFLKEGIKR